MSRKQERRLRKKRRWKAKRADIRRARELVEHGLSRTLEGNAMQGFVPVSSYFKSVVLNPSWMVKCLASKPEIVSSNNATIKFRRPKL